METLVGDAFLSAATIAYCGIYDQGARNELHREWMKMLQQFGIRNQPQHSLVDHLSNLDEQCELIDQGLPNDHLCLENAIMLNHAHRYPLLIDPSGQATNYLRAHFKVSIISSALLLSYFNSISFRL